MLNDRLQNVIRGLIRLERSRRIESLEGEIRDLRDDFTRRGALGHGRLPMMVEQVCANELEHRAQTWLAIVRRAFADSSTPWTAANADNARRLLSAELSQDWDGLLDRYRASVAPHDPSQRFGSLDTARERAGSQVAHEVDLLVLGQDRARIPLSEQLVAPRYDAVHGAWTKALELAAGEPMDSAQCAKEAVGGVEQLARIVIGDSSATLGDCIKQLRQARRIEPPLLKGIEWLWGWTSGEPGVRHGAAGDGGPTPTEALYCLKLAEASLLLLLTVDSV